MIEAASRRRKPLTSRLTEALALAAGHEPLPHAHQHGARAGYVRTVTPPLARYPG